MLAEYGTMSFERSAGAGNANGKTVTRWNNKPLAVLKEIKNA
jgi:hypothetical protein